MKHIDHNDYCCDNTWLRNSNNKTFTYSQLLGAMRFGVAPYDSLPKDIKRKITRYLVQEGYLK